MVVLMDKYIVQCFLVGDVMIGKFFFVKVIIGQNFDEGYIVIIEDIYLVFLFVVGDKYFFSILDLFGQVNRFFFKQ